MGLFPMNIGGGSTSSFDTATRYAYNIPEGGQWYTAHAPKDSILVFFSEYPDPGGTPVYNGSGMVLLGNYAQSRDHYSCVGIWKATADTQTFQGGLVCSMVYVI